MSAASPGVIAVFSPNRYYASQEEYLGALAELPPYAVQLSRGYPAIPTVFEPDGAEP